MRRYVAETESNVPFPLIDFHETNDECGKAIREIIPGWNVATSELEAFKSGDYNPFVESFGHMKMEALTQAVQLFADTWRYITPAGTDPIAEAAIGKIISSVRRNHYNYLDIVDKKTLMDFVLANPDHELSRKIHLPRTIVVMEHQFLREAKMDMCYMIRQCLTEQFILRLLARTRELLQATQPLDTITADRYRLVVQEPEDPEWEHWPFRDSQCALTALITCLHFIHIDHNTTYGCRDSYRSNTDATEVGFHRAGNINWASHWSMLYQYLRKDIEANGPVPEELKFFYGSVELASRLERVGYHQYRQLWSNSPEVAKEIIPIIAAARESYSTNHELWDY